MGEWRTVWQHWTSTNWYILSISLMFYAIYSRDLTYTFMAKENRTVSRVNPGPSAGCCRTFSRAAAEGDGISLTWAPSTKKLSRERTLHKISRFEMGFWISFYFFKKRFERLSNIWILWWASWAKLPVSWNSYVAPLFWVFTRRNIICHLFTACIRVHKNLII